MNVLAKLRSWTKEFFRSAPVCDPTSNGEIEILRQVIKEGVEPVVIMDVGANKGDYIALILKIAAELKKRVQVHAFEPQLHNYKLLQNEYSNIDFIHLNNFALSDETGTSVIYADAPGSPMASFYNRKFFNDHKLSVTQEIIKSSTLSAYVLLYNLKKIDLIKIDVEGHELKVLKGLENILRQGNSDIQKIQFEYGGTYLDSNTKLFDIYKILSPWYNIGRINGRTVKYVEYEMTMEDYKYANYLAEKKR